MFIRMLPGLGATLLLGLLLCLAPEMGPSMGRQAEQRGFEPRERLAPASFLTPVSATPTRHSSPYIRLEPLRKMPLAPALQHHESPREANAPADFLNRPTGAASAAGNLPDPLALRAIRAMSPSGLAIVPPGSGVAAISSNSGLASLPCADPPDRGIYLWTFGEAFAARQKFQDSDTQYSDYRHEGYSAGVGVKYDWSIDSIIGLSLDRLEQKVKSRHESDDRRNDITGYRLTGHYSGTLLQKYLLDGGLFYGSVDNKGHGSAGGLPWREAKHRSHIYGGSVNFGVPLVYGDDFKIHPSLGFAYAKVKSKGYRVDWETTRFAVDEKDSASMTVPMRLEVKRDFLRQWGCFTPRLSAGYTRELKDGATGVRVMNASGGGMVTDVDYGNRRLAIRHDKSDRNFYDFGLGLDMRTYGGWEFSADYIRCMARKYTNDTFSLEAGRCF